MVVRRKTKSREHILRAAADLFYLKGIHTTSMDEVVAKAGVAKPTFYQHFSSKAELVAAVVALRSDAWNEAIDQRIDAARTPVGRLNAVFGFLESFIDDEEFRGCALVNASLEVLDPSSPARKVAEDNKKNNRLRIEKLARDAGLKNPRALAWDLYLIFEGAIVSAYVENDQSIGRKASNAAKRLIVNAR